MLSKNRIKTTFSLEALEHEQERAHRDCALIKDCTKCYRANEGNKCDLALLTQRIAEIAIGKEVRKKILPIFFKEVFIGNKNFELRVDEDNIQPGDTLILCEWNGTAYTGREVTRTVKYVLRNVPQYGLQKGFCIIGW